MGVTMFRKSKYMMLICFVLVVLSACSSNKTEMTIEEKNPELEVNSTFSIPVTFGDGKNGEYILVGEKGKSLFKLVRDQKMKLLNYHQL